MESEKRHASRPPHQSRYSQNTILMSASDDVAFDYLRGYLAVKTACRMTVFSDVTSAAISHGPHRIVQEASVSIESNLQAHLSDSAQSPVKFQLLYVSRMT